MNSEQYHNKMQIIIDLFPSLLTLIYFSSLEKGLYYLNILPQT